MNSTRADEAIGTIDHVVIVVGDLVASAEVYRRLGFTLSSKGVHGAALGTENHTIMLQHDYFELLAVRQPTERNTHWREVAAQGGGVAGMALATGDASAARQHWLDAGFTPDMPLKFSRAVPRPDGSTLEARFEVVSLHEISGVALRLFVCSQPTRDAVWLPELLEHANSAMAIRRVRIACPDPQSSARQWQRAMPLAQATSHGAAITLDTGMHQIELEQGVGPDVRALGIDYLVADLGRCRSVLQRNGIDHAIDSARIVVPAASACNVAIGFQAAH